MAINYPPINFHIRPMLMDDLEQVKVIDRLSFSMPWSDNAYRYEIMENPASLLLVAEAESANRDIRVCGMVVVWLILDETHIATLGVHPDYRGLGIGKQLLNVALEESARQGANLATLEVRDSNKVAQKIYRKFGFENVGRRRRYYQDNREDAILMTLNSLKEFKGPERISFESKNVGGDM
ncbi:MAG: ribosomal protein S18-alanine N-acetyltransferase [Anaerolineales bacterium]|nr:ribosomal protein S18-alanine N-acetyltransferase [Anaerolineales bacterium]